MYACSGALFATITEAEQWLKGKIIQAWSMSLILGSFGWSDSRLLKEVGNLKLAI
jgi:hypothetical protein